LKDKLVELEKREAENQSNIDSRAPEDSKAEQQKPRRGGEEPD